MEISIDHPHKLFDIHLEHENNDRILFSGKFGTGKSHFLRKYFEHHKDKYNLFWISPVDYVVGANQDIFEWIKIDIAKEILKNYLPTSTKQKKDDKKLIYSTYLYNNSGKILTDLVLLLPDKILKKCLDIEISSILKKHTDKVAEFEKQINEEDKPGFQKLSDYLTFFTQLSGTIFEDNTVTQLLRASLNYLHERTEKQSVLIIDDLDRLDPEHIFRILNILSAHNNHFDSNKFGFQKVILVCDIQNIEHLFRYRYGPNSDFDGYIEKFYTYEPFKYTILNSIALYCSTDYIANNIDEDNQVILKTILKLLVENGLLKIRNLKKINGWDEDVIFQPYSSSFHGHIELYASQFIEPKNATIDLNKYDFLKTIKLLAIALGGYDKVNIAITELSKSNINSKIETKIAVNTLAVISHFAKNFNSYRIFFDVKFGRDSANYHVQLPTITFLGVDFELPLRWEVYRRYINGDYFIMTNKEAIYNRFYNRNTDSHVEIKTILPEIKHIVSIMDKLHYTPNSQ